MVLVRLCSICAFFRDSSSFWSRKSSYSETASCLPCGSTLDALAGEGEWVASDPKEPVLPACLSALEDADVSLSAEDAFGL